MTTAGRLRIPKLDAISPEWLTSVLRRHDEFADLTVESVRSERIGVGVGTLSDLARLHLTYSEGRAGPATLVAKVSTSNEANRPVVEAFDFYRREVAFFRDVADLTMMRTPRCYHGDVDDDFESIIIMEDAHGYVLGDQVVGCTRSQAETLIRELAALHGPLWDKVDGPTFDHIPLHRSAQHGDNYANFAPSMWDATAANHPQLIPAELVNARQRFLDAIVPLQEWINSPPRTLVHGDFRLGNLLFSDTPGQSPVVVIDWQAAHRAKGIIDVAYLLSQNVEVEDRRDWDHSLVELYCEELQNYGVTYGPELGFEEYKKATTYLWVSSLYAGSVDLIDGAGLDWVVKWVSRSATAIVDFDGLQYLNGTDGTRV